MGLLDLHREIVTEFKADISDHKAKIKELDGAEKELAETELQNAEARNENITSWLEGAAKVTLALTALKEVGEIVWDGYKEGIQEAKLETAAMGVDIEALSEAAGGLKTNIELLTFAAKANHSAFKNTQEDMENAERAMRVLEARGYSTAEAQDAVTAALVSGKTKGLEPFGVVVDKHIDKLQLLGEENLTLAQKTEVHKHALESIKIVGDQVVEGQDNIGDSMGRTEVSLSNSWAKLKIGLGELVIKMQPLLESLAKAVGYVAKLSKYAGIGDGPEMLGKAADLAGDTFSWLGGGLSGESHRDISGNLGMGAFGSGFRKGASASPDKSGDGIGYGDLVDYLHSIGPTAFDVQNLKVAYEEWIKSTKEAADKTKAAAKQAAASAKSLAAEEAKRSSKTAKSLTDDLVAKLEFEQGKGVMGPEDVEADRFAKQMSDEADEEVASRESRYAQFQKKSDKKLEKLFGPVGDLDLYKKGFEALSGAIGNMYDAMVSGSEPASQAIKKTIAASVEAVGKQMSIEAVKEAAYAIGSLAMYNYPAAAAHAASAAEFAAGAVIAGVVAHELGFGGGTSAGSASAGPTAGAPSTLAPASAASTQPDRVVVYADSYADDSPRMKVLKAQRLLALAGAGTGVTSG